MTKREHEDGQASGVAETEGSRNKRRREMADESSDVDVIMSDPVITGGEGGERRSVSAEVVKEQAVKLWQTVKDAVNKEGRSLSLVFLRKPSKRQYPDYYQIIQQPIALDDIKKGIDNGTYPSIEAIRQDFELCFTNAKQYNMKDSDIWRDAKDLLKLVNKTYNKIVPPEEDGDGEGDGGKRGKSKTPNMNRLIKSRLQKLVDKTDELGRVLSTEFMELPSRKDWPMYYKEIKKPQCLENVFKHIKRKEYDSSAEFAADVELVFANALVFNQEHTGIWEDARTLRDYFRQTMSDLPPPHALPEYSRPSNGKIKIKMPQPTQPSGAVIPPQPPQHPLDKPSAPTSILLRVPAVNSTTENSKAQSQSTSTPTVSQAPIPVPTPASTVPPPAPPVAVPITQPILPTQPIQPPSTTPQPVMQTLSYINATFSHYPNASYQPSVTTSTAPTASSSTSGLPTNAQTNSTSNSPTPPGMHPSHQLKAVLLKIQPRGRTVYLDYRDGVKIWALRLGHGETGVKVGAVRFLSDEEEESSGEEEEPDPEGKREEEEEEEEQLEVNAPVKNGRKRGKGKGRGRPPKGTKVNAPVTKVVGTAKKKQQKAGQIQLKLNGFIVKGQEDQTGKWNVNLPVGSNILEVGEAGGLVWKVYVERLNYV